MKFTVADLLDHLSFDSPVETGVLAKILKLSNTSEKQDLELAIDSLLKLGIIEKASEDGLLRSSNESLLDARLRCSSKGFCFAIRDDGGDDVYIRDHQLNHAWNGDRVMVRITREGGRRRSPEGGVQCILERSTRSLLAQVERQDEQMLAAPLDDRMLTTIMLPEQASAHLSGDPPESVVEVSIDRYPVAQHPAEGHVVRPLPLNGGPTADRDLLLTKAGLQHRVAPPRGSGKAPATKGRTDLTEQPSLLLTSWEAPEAPALPAVHVEAREGGARIWIHAPSVAERIGLGNSLDLWLRERGEALCLGELWQPLLTPNLNKMVCFKEGEIKEAVTVRLDVDAEGEISDWQFMLSTIRPRATVNALQLKALSERKPRARTVPAALKPIKDHLSQLETLVFSAGSLCSRERKDGSVQLDLQPPSLPALGDLRWADPSGLRHRWVDEMDPTDPQSLLQPLLRAANKAWDNHRNDLGLPGISVQAGEADASVLTDVAKTAIALELPLELDEEGSPSAEELISVFNGSDHRRVLEQQLSHSLPQPMFEAVGEKRDSEQQTDKSRPAGCAPWCCAAQHYAHLVNQQVIVALLQEGKDRPTVRQKKRLDLGHKGCGEELTWSLFTTSQEEKLLNLIGDRLIQKLNVRLRQSLELEKDLLSMVQARCAQPLVGKQSTGRISGVQSYGFFVEVGESRVEGLVHVSSLNDDWYEYRSRQNRLVGRKSRRVYQLGDSVQVRVIKVDVLRNQIDLEAIATPIVEQEKEEGISEPLPVTFTVD